MLFRTKDTCRHLNISKSGLKALRDKCPDFPKPIKIGNTRQSPVFYKKEDLDKWVANLNAETFNLESKNDSK